MMPDDLDEFAVTWTLSPACTAALAELLRGRADEENHTFVADGVSDADPGPSVGSTVPARYDDRGRLGGGGMGEVRRVYDRDLRRTCAWKVVRADLLAKPHLVARFVEEAQVAGQLQHPNIPPVYHSGRLADGRPWFSMKEVHGRTLSEVIRAGDRSVQWLIDTFCKVCDGVGYAHERGVVHRDLKPDNVMIGAHGEVLVIDWGLAKVLGSPDGVGGVMGTPAYMAPEQARGEIERLDARSDVYALGAILYELLAGRPPYPGGARAALAQVLAGPPRPLATGPAELVALCERCMAREQADRPADGSHVAAEARAWLDGAKKTHEALRVVALAEAMNGRTAPLLQRAVALRAEGDTLLAGVVAWEPEARKIAGWTLQDEAEQVEREAMLLELRREALLRGALTHAPALEQAHAALAEIEFERHAAAEDTRAPREMAHAEERLREHAAALPPDHPVAQRAAAYLQGDGSLTLTTDPEGCEVELFRYELRNRRLTAVPVKNLGKTPILDLALPMGSYLCLLRHRDRAEVRYPVHLGRGERWDCVSPVQLPRRGELGPSDCLVPAGWFWSGGDDQATGSLPRRRLWCDEFVMQRFPVTHREYLVFLDDLVAQGREEEAVVAAPRERVGGDVRTLLYGRDAHGRFVLRPDADGDSWDPEWPVVLIDWFGASAYADWLAARTGAPWRLPFQQEWEKAARGVDGRFHPWGDGFDPSWCRMRESRPGKQAPVVVDSFPVDESVYGVRGVSGNVLDWCADAWPTGAGEPARGRSGGGWAGTPRSARCAVRGHTEPRGRSVDLGFRCVFRPGERF